MNKVAITVLGVLTLTASANAQGTWYTDYATWKSLITNELRAAYVIEPSGSSPWTENGVTATAASGSWIPINASGGALSTASVTSVTFTSYGNAFAGTFMMSNSLRAPVEGAIVNFNINGSLTPDYSLTTTPGSKPYTFIGYISNSASDISVKVTGASANQYTNVNYFSFGQSTSSLGGNVAPEPGTLALALTGGCALVGMVIRRRRMSN